MTPTMETIEDLTVELTLPGAALARAVERRLARWGEERFAERLWAKDPTLWAPDPGECGPPFPPELENRLGWLDLPRTDPGELSAFAEEVRRDGLRHAVLLGMGGSSLAPEVLHGVLGARPGYPELTVLDSTHPEAVRAVRQDLEATGGPARALFLVASKSGTTVETLSLFRYFWEEVAAATPEPGACFAAVTDPGTPLADLAGERRFRRVFLAPPDVGGRYSALSVFGLAPAAVGGLDLGRLLARIDPNAGPTAGGGLRERLRAPAPENPGLRLAAVLAEAALTAGRDKLTFLAAPALAQLPSWIEQLVAESLGKDGRGIVPVADEPVQAAGAYGPDRLFVSLELGEGGYEDEAGRLAESLEALAAAGHPVVRIGLPDRHDLGGAMLLWEVATAAAGAALGVHPFDQPDVELAKRRAKEAMAGEGDAAAGVEEVPVHDGERLRRAVAEWLGDAGAASDGDEGGLPYVALQVFLPPTPEIDQDLRELRLLVADRRRLATTAGYGPRFLHSTGQLHKGGPAAGLFLQLVDDPAAEVPVPGAGHGFGELIRAQAVGDYRALVEAGRRVLRVQLGRDRATGLARLQKAFEDAL
jgi:transaldolase/glucose-6-phosphate isomerase